MRSYLSARTQRVKIGCNYSSRGTILKGVPQGSILGPKIFNCFLNDLLITLSRYCTPGNYADDNTICVMHPNKQTMLSNLKIASQIAIQWFDDNLMQANPEKFQFMVFSPFRKKDKDATYALDLGSVKLTNVAQAPLLGVLFDRNLSFNAHVLSLCKKANFQLLTLKRLARSMDTQTKLTILKSFIRSNFTYCCHIWYFCSPTLRQKVETIQFRGLRYVYNDYTSSYTVLLERSGMQSIELLIQKTILVEIFKSIHNIGATYLSNLFRLGKNSTRSNQVDLFVPRVHTKFYGLHSLRYHGTQLWLHLLQQAKITKDLEEFKKCLKFFKGVPCKCAMCKSNLVSLGGR